MTDLSFKQWLVETLRVTAFYGQVSEENRRDWINWWTTLVGVPPEKTELRRRDGIVHEIGPFKGADLILTIQPGRLDWLLRPNDRLEEQRTDNADFSSLSHVAIASFHDLIKRWILLGSYPRVKRLAVGAILLQPVENRQAGYEKFAGYLHNVKLDPASSDFIYQINRPRQIELGSRNLKINRLCKWAVMLKGEVIFSIALTDKARAMLSGNTESQGVNACRLELDINTASENETEFTQDEVIRLYSELIQQSQEIAEKGDVK